MNTVMTSADFRLRMESQGFAGPPAGSAPYNRYPGDQIARWSHLIRTAGIKAV